MQKTILIVDDDKKFVDSLEYNFNKDNYKLECICNCETMLKKIEEDRHDLVILKKDMEGIDGIELCKKIRNISIVPIIMIAQTNEEMSKILAFEYGADDYLVTPFNFLELKVRINTIFRRMQYKLDSEPKHIFKVNDFTINFLKRNISIKEKNINLTVKEFDLFYILSSNAGKVFSREELLNEVWGYGHYGDIRTVDVHIRRIREKIETKAEETKYIMTKWGEGYYFNTNTLIS